MWNKIQNIHELKLALKGNDIFGYPNDLLYYIAFNAGKYYGFSFYINEIGTIKYCADVLLYE
jgi:hypothetical protein